MRVDVFKVLSRLRQNCRTLDATGRKENAGEHFYPRLMVQDNAEMEPNVLIGWTQHHMLRCGTRADCSYLCFINARAWSEQTTRTKGYTFGAESIRSQSLRTRLRSCLSKKYG